jgi:hypothetical protein
MWVRVRLAGAYLAGVCVAGACVLLLSGCAAIDPVDSRYDTISRSLAKARNESILLNLVRASADYPLSFVTIANVTPTVTNTTTFGLPTFLFGPLNPGPAPSFTPGRDVIFGNTTASNSTAIGSNFNVSTQETTTFYQGFLKPIDLQILHYFIRQGYSRELLFWLFTDAVEVEIPGRGTLGTRYNPPNDYGCPPHDTKKRCFSEFVLVAVAAGLTVEERSIQRVAEKSGDSSGGGKPQTIVVPRFCFNPVLQEEAHIAMGPELWRTVTTKYFDERIDRFTPKCDDPNWKPEDDYKKWQPDKFNFSVGSIQFKIVPRSAYGVFEFLGNLIKMERDHPPRAAWIPPERLAEGEDQLPQLKTAPVAEDRFLITVVPDNSQACFVHTWFFDGHYCVPESATNTKRIFGLLAQLIAITTNATDLSITPIVRIIQ